MLAAVFKRRGVLEIEDRPQPKGLGEEEVLLEVEGSGVCGTDLHILSDPPGHPATEGVILGHEIVARVIAKGSRVQQFDVGTRIKRPDRSTADTRRFTRIIVSTFPNKGC